ncbi:universal stress protein [Puniceibacterium sediminis]|uniref:Nucleotide-binding universal stress protein, UspA family n=1 Tax=Puniceibacterium sediminis TaxID=1608407 RepID=A0A238VX74_9RHOB|nr:universal stress protein [Puniceibacterium sediminis]SNR38069.1 Nucleotide-binding universal stress protein, UspA family [Puniceibacterium sediminis]
MSGKIVVGYDGSAAGRRALDFALAQAKAQDASVLIAHVLEWSPYSFLTAEELAERHKRRNEEMARAETAVLAPVLEKLKDSGVPVETVIKYGHIAEKLSDIATQAAASQLVVGRDGQGSLVARVFGSVAGTLVQIAKVPTTIVP